ncbi:MAG: monovalent cation/H(+) antiporter subunit G [Candidatus Woesearchaeota archaeon]
MIGTIVLVLLSVGILFNILAIIGLLRFPDVYTRLHAATKCTTFGMIFITAATVVYSINMKYAGVPEFGPLATHSLAAFAAILLTNPTGAHAISRAAHKAGIKPEKAVIDQLEKDGMTKVSAESLQKKVQKKSLNKKSTKKVGKK